MSALAPFATRTALRRAATVAPSRSLVACAPRFYSAGRHKNDRHTAGKQPDLSENPYDTSTAIDNAPGWNEYLASPSEADVKADKTNIKPSELQKRTVKQLNARHDNLESSTADSQEQGTNTARMSEDETVEVVYERDEVIGPLKSAHGAGSEFVVEEEVDTVVRRFATK